MSAPSVKFIESNRDRARFHAVLKQRIDAYFRDNALSPHANTSMVIKTISMLLMWFVPYAVIMSGQAPVWLGYLSFVVMGFAMPGIGFCIMHDANHGAYSANPTVNKWLGYTLNLVGGNALNWRIQHNVLHHTYTNIHGMDEDIRSHGVLRLSPHAPLSAAHKYQHIYALPMYGLITLNWVLIKDYKQLYQYYQRGLVQRLNAKLAPEMTIVVITKLIYFTYVLALPILFSGIGWGHIVLGFLLMNYISGVILAVVFQLAHVVDEAEYPMPDDNNTIGSNWAIHQIETTANFAPTNQLINWYVGGLNFQVEHHLFPNVCHVHYPALSPIVRQVAEEYGVSYHSQPTVMGALKSHLHSLYRLGREQSDYSLKAAAKPVAAPSVPVGA